MIAFCTHCWAEIDDQVNSCPGCGADQSFDTRSYEEKIVAALRHPLPAARARICWLIGETRIRDGVTELMALAKSDPDVYVQKAAIEALGTIGDTQSTILLREIGKGKNRFLAAAANKSVELANGSQT